MGSIGLLLFVMVCLPIARGDSGELPTSDKSDGKSSRNCGHYVHSHSGENIVGGRLAHRGELPWQLLLTIGIGDTRYLCGATLVDATHAITAAHCLFDGDLSRPREVVAGIIDGHRKGDYKQIREFPQVFIHPNYGLGSIDDDIAILKFKRPFKLNKWVSPACLPTRNTSLSAGDTLRISGFGRPVPGEPVDEKLRIIDVPFHEDRKCPRNFGVSDRPFHPEMMFCAGLLEGGKDSCLGDTGGPAVKIEKNKATLVGVVSFGPGCGEHDALGVYAEVKYFMDWIEKIINLD